MQSLDIMDDKIKCTAWAACAIGLGGKTPGFIFKAKLNDIKTQDLFIAYICDGCWSIWKNEDAIHEGTYGIVGVFDKYVQSIEIKEKDYHWYTKIGINHA